MEQIIHQFINNFDFAFMFIINIITYFSIKILDEINKEKIVTTWQKRIIFIICSIIVGIIYYYLSDIPHIKIIDSIIVAPIAWSWVLRPICVKLNIDYKKIDKYLK